VFALCSHALRVAAIVAALACSSKLSAQCAAAEAESDCAQDGHAFAAALIGYGSTNDPTIDPRE
jgi:hypothetical protein